MNLSLFYLLLTTPEQAVWSPHLEGFNTSQDKALGNLADLTADPASSRRLD